MDRQTRRKELFSLLKHTEQNFNDRTNFFLIAEAVFLVAFAIVLDKQPVIFQFIFEVSGLLIGLIWLHLGKHSYKNLGLLQHEVKRRNIFPEYQAWRERCNCGVRFWDKYFANEIIGIWFPRIIVAIWIAALIISWISFFQFEQVCPANKSPQLNFLKIKMGS